MNTEATSALFCFFLLQELANNIEKYTRNEEGMDGNKEGGKVKEGREK